MSDNDIDWTAEVTVYVSVSFKAPADLDDDTLWKLAEERYADGDWDLHGHEIDSIDPM